MKHNEDQVPTNEQKAEHCICVLLFTRVFYNTKPQTKIKQ